MMIVRKWQFVGGQFLSSVLHVASTYLAISYSPWFWAVVVLMVALNVYDGTFIYGVVDDAYHRGAASALRGALCRTERLTASSKAKTPQTEPMTFG